jgi:uncharacterized protein (DUF1684 family)
MANDKRSETLAEFRQMMDEALRTHDSWLALAGLFWLKPGSNTIGSDKNAEVVLPAAHAPALLGSIEMEGEAVRLRIEPPNKVKIDGEDTATAVLAPDTSGAATTVHFGPLTWMVIERSGRLGIRLWDNSRPEMHSFPGRSWFPERPDLSVEASFVPDEGAQPLRIENTIGDVELVPAAGRLIFDIQGKELTLQSMGDPGAGLSILFKDLTNGETTYAPGRYLATEAVENGKVIVDFNRAYNPPCAFTAFATCPLPPLENQLPIRVEAGERLPDGIPAH